MVIKRKYLTFSNRYIIIRLRCVAFGKKILFICFMLMLQQEMLAKGEICHDTQLHICLNPFCFCDTNSKRLKIVILSIKFWLLNGSRSQNGKLASPPNR